MLAIDLDCPAELRELALGSSEEVPDLECNRRVRRIEFVDFVPKRERRPSGENTAEQNYANAPIRSRRSRPSRCGGRFCHSERSRGISRYISVQRIKRAEATARDSSTPLGMTRKASPRQDASVSAQQELRPPSDSALRRFARELGSRPKRFASAKAGSLLSVFVSCTPAMRASSASKWSTARRFGSFSLR